MTLRKMKYVVLASLLVSCQQYKHDNECTCDDCNLAPIELLRGEEMEK